MWQHAVYLISLLTALLCLTLIDYRFKLAFFDNPRRAARTILPAMAVFIFWDILGIALKIFYDGSIKYRTGWQLGPQFPVEELFFLALLCYITLLLWNYFRSEDV